MRRIVWLGVLLGGLFGGSVSAMEHKAWTELLQRHVVPFNDGVATAVDYAGFAKQRAELTDYLDALSAVTEPEFEQWSSDTQLAFLINAYNAWTVELILTAYPDLDSIRDLGSLFRSPWKREFIPLLGQERSLDEIEHEMIRGSGRYNEPRIHFAVNCASIGCPALLSEAFEADTLEQQLDQATRAFLSDSSRNRWSGDEVEVSSIFRWYRDDFAAGWQGTNRLGEFLALYADELGVPDNQRARLAAEQVPIRFLDYDWALNDVKSSSVANMPREN